MRIEREQNSRVGSRHESQGGDVAEETFTCDRCANDFPIRQMKEVVYEEGKTRGHQHLCPACLDQVMNESEKVRGIAGSHKAAAIHIDPPPGGAEGGSGPAAHQSFGTRAR
jgi:hypothetical protein